MFCGFNCSGHPLASRVRHLKEKKQGVKDQGVKQGIDRKKTQQIAMVCRGFDFTGFAIANIVQLVSETRNLRGLSGLLRMAGGLAYMHGVQQHVFGYGW